MAKIDPEVERQRLAKLYATMNDLELAEVAGEPTALSAWAFDALRNEMTKRGLDWAGGSAALATLREAASVKQMNREMCRRYCGCIET